MAFRQCPGCGLYEQEIGGSLQVGCAQCYTTFFDLLSPTIWNYQGSTVHHGQAPKPTPPGERWKAEAYREAIEKARSEGRQDDVLLFRDLLRLLGEDVD